MSKTAKAKHKLRKGRPFTSIGQLDSLLRQGKWVYLRDKPLHHQVVRSMTFSTLALFINSHALFRAVLVEQEATRK